VQALAQHHLRTAVEDLERELEAQGRSRARR